MNKNPKIDPSKVIITQPKIIRENFKEKRKKMKSLNYSENRMRDMSIQEEAKINTAQKIMVDNLEKSMLLLIDSCKKQAINGVVHISYVEQVSKIIVDGYKQGIES